MALSNCYQCEAQIEVESLDTVHELCKDCDTAFDDWFANQLRMFDKAGGKLNG